MDEQKVRELLQNYRLGRCSEKEAAWIETWYTLTAENAKASVDELESSQQESWKRIQAGMRQQDFFQARIRPMPVLYWAASIAALLCLGFFFFYNDKTKGVTENEMVTLATRPGEIASFILPDSSVVTLNAASSIRFAKVFTGGRREVQVREGEAFFDVRHQPSKPFIVHAGRTKTQVLGTAFGIRAYQFLKDIQVTVTRGKVGVGSAAGFPKAETAFLLPGDKLIVSNKNGDVRKVHTEIEAASSWLKGFLNFDNEDLATIALLLEKKYDVGIKIDGKQLREQRLTARFQPKETLDEVLTTLSAAGNFSFKHASGRVQISMNEY